MATGYQWVDLRNNDCENSVEDRSTTSSVNVGSDIDDENAGSVQSGNGNEINPEGISSKNVKKQRRQPQRSIKISRDSMKFISQTPEYSKQLGEKLEKLCAEMQLIPEKSLVKIVKKRGSMYITEWGKQCTSAVKTLCSRFRKDYLELKDPTRVQKNMPKLGDMLRWSSAAYWIEDENPKLVVMTEQSERDKVLEKINEFLQISENNAKEGAGDKVNSINSANESNVNHLRQKSAATLASQQQEKQMPIHDKSSELEPVSVEINNDIVKFVMNNSTFAHELEDELKLLNAELQWEAGSDVITIVQKSTELLVPRWSEECKSSATKFFKRFRKESCTVQNDIQDSICNKLEDIRRSISSSGADCWLASNNRTLVLVSLKKDFASVSKTVKDFLENARVENEKLKQIVKFVEVSSDLVDYLERVQFLDTVKQSHSGIVEATITEARNEICFVGSDEAISAAKQQYEDLVKELNIIRLQLPTEVIKFISQEAGLEFIDQCLLDRKIVFVDFVVECSSILKVVSRSSQECEEVKECLCKNISEATINLTSKNEHSFNSKKWEEIFKAIQSEKLIDCEVNIVRDTPCNVKLHGASHLVEKYEKIVRDFIKSQEIIHCKMRLPPAIARFMKEKSGKELEKIESDLREEKVKINIKQTNDSFECILSGTNEGIHESQKRIVAIRGEIATRSERFSSVGVAMLVFSENGRQNIKGIEAGTNTIIEVSKVPEITKEESNQAEVEAMRAERAQRNAKMKKVPSAPLDPFDQCNFTTSEGLNVSWKYGNIEQQRADILVSSAANDLNNPTAVGRVLNLIGGPSFVAACSQHTNIMTGDIATTTGGNLQCSYVIHAVCCRWNNTSVAEQTLRNLLQKILLVCTSYLANSVAMPLIGTGKHGFPEDLVLRLMQEEFEKFSSMNPRSTLKEIKLVRFDKRRGTAYQPQQASGLIGYPMATSSYKPFASLVAGGTVESVTLQVYARSVKDISSALDEMKKFIRNNIKSKRKEHKNLVDVVLEHWDEIKQLAKDNGLRITCVNTTTVSIEGMFSKVVEANDKLTELVSRYIDKERMLNQLSYVTQNVQWYCYNDSSGKQVAYDAQLNGTIEVARMNGETVVEIFENDGQQYDIDFTRMVARNKKSGQTKRLTRKLIGSATCLGPESSLPINWTSQPDHQVFQLAKLDPSSQEYREVLNHFVARGGNASQLYMVERIQNPRLYLRYLAFKNSMRGRVNEMRLFHGTDAANIDSINANNFNRNFAGVNGVAYGNGVYFARDASYSMRYAIRQLSGSLPKMYIAKVLVGEYTNGKKGMKTPPTKNDPYNPGLCYDSVVDNCSNPSMYIIFQDNQCYPEYLLTMR